MNIPNCPTCNSEYVYEDGTLIVCPECAHEWSKLDQIVAEEANIVNINFVMNNVGYNKYYSKLNSRNRIK